MHHCHSSVSICSERHGYWRRLHAVLPNEIPTQGDGYHELNKHIESLNHGIPVFDRLRFYGLFKGGDLDELQGVRGDEINRRGLKGLCPLLPARCINRATPLLSQPV
jgi:hypothetical protein